MQTTIDLDDDVLAEAKDRAAHENRTVGEVFSDLWRQSMPAEARVVTRNGITLLPTRPGVVVTDELVRQLRDEIGE